MQIWIKFSLPVRWSLFLTLASKVQPACPHESGPLPKMIPYDEVETYVGHAPGGVCPFGVNEGVAVYLDESLRKFDTVYPAAGNGHTAVKLTLQELEAAAGAEGWVDVCKEPEGE